MRNLENLFSYHQPTPEKVERYNRIRTAALVFAQAIQADCPEDLDTTAAIDQVSLASMLANRAIACNP